MNVGTQLQRQLEVECGLNESDVGALSRAVSRAAHSLPFSLASCFLSNQNKSHLAIWDLNSNRGGK